MFFFSSRRRHTRLQGDWSSDVCSSDLNLAQAMEALKAAGYWLIGLDERAERNYTQADYTSPVGIVLGGEGKGLHDLVRKRCDFVVSLPTTGPVRSLNVSVAAGIVLFEAVRQRSL